MDAKALIQKLQLKPHPEGGWFREIHRASERVTTARGARSALTTIYYLLERGQLSRWHVVQSDEVWHFYAGAPLELVVYDSTARVCKPMVLAAASAATTATATAASPVTAAPIGLSPPTVGAASAAIVTQDEGHEPVGIVHAGEWQAARSLGDYSLVGCNVGPGFEFEDFRFVSDLPGHAEHFSGELVRYRSLL
jgi:predicted cupin superfamily sugar epimerase